MHTVSIKEGTQVVEVQLLNEMPECEYVVERDAEVTVLVYASGQHSLEGKTHVRLVGQRARAQIIGVFVTTEGTVKLHTLQHHEAENTTSNLLVKTVLSGTATFLYDGAIRVEQAGQKTDAYQRNENLLLSEGASAHSKPSLEILANDVRCTHGATICSVDPEQLFFLATRGLGPNIAKRLLVEGFLEAPLLSLSDTILRERVKEVLWQTLSKQLQ